MEEDESKMEEDVEEKQGLQASPGSILGPKLGC